MRLYGHTLPTGQVDPHQAAKFEDEAGRYWDLFYKRNADRFFKDRHYFDKEWPQLTQGALTVLEVGCGAGNTVFPLLELNPQLYVYACDFSPRAVGLVKAHPAYSSTGRVSAFVCDITQCEGPGALVSQLPGPVVDYCSMVFVLSAVAPHKMRQVLRNVACVLVPGSGRLLFRDYADGDMAQARLQDNAGVRLIRGNFYARGDGTCCYYFGQAELDHLLASEGYVCESSLIHARTIENRKTGVQLKRRWIQAIFRYDPAAAAAQQQQQGGVVLPPELLMQQPPRQSGDSALQHDAQQGGAQQQQQQQQLGTAVGAPPAAAAAAGLSSSSAALTTPAEGPAAAVSSSDAAGVCRVQCAGRLWRLPASLTHGHCTGGNGGSDGGRQCCRQHCCCVCLAAALSGLVEQQQMDLLGQCVLIAPPWLRIKQQQQQQQQEGETLVQQPAAQQQLGACCGSDAAPWPLLVHQPLQQEGPVVCCAAAAVEPRAYETCAAAAGVEAGAAVGSQQGAAAALLALVAVWRGARRVYVCCPGSSDAGSAHLQEAGPSAAAAASAAEDSSRGGSSSSSSVGYMAGLNAVLRLNESSVVSERIWQRQWGQAGPQHAQQLGREVSRFLTAGRPKVPRGLVVLATAAAAGCSCACCSSAGVVLAAPWLELLQQVCAAWRVA